VRTQIREGPGGGSHLDFSACAAMFFLLRWGQSTTTSSACWGKSGPGCADGMRHTRYPIIRGRGPLRTSAEAKSKGAEDRASAADRRSRASQGQNGHERQERTSTRDDGKEVEYTSPTRKGAKVSAARQTQCDMTKREEERESLLRVARRAIGRGQVGRARLGSTKRGLTRDVDG